MALIRDFDRKDLQQPKRQGVVDATFSSFELEGEKFVQFDTYGSAERQMPGKRSQSFRVNRRTAEKIVKILQAEFKL